MQKFFEELTPMQKAGMIAAGAIAIFGIYKIVKKNKPRLFSLVLEVKGAESK